MRRGVVIAEREENFCVVDFDDGSMSNDLFPSDVIYCSCRLHPCHGAHISGAKVKVGTWGLVLIHRVDDCSSVCPSVCLHLLASGMNVGRLAV